MATLFSDNFNRADSTNLGATWSELSGNWQVATNRLAPQFGVNEQRVITTTTAHAAVEDMIVSVTLVTAGGLRFGGPMARVTASDTFYLLQHEAAANRIALYKVVSGTFTLLDSWTPGAADGDILRLEVEGTDLRAYQNGGLLGTVSDSAITGEGQAGVRCFNPFAGASVDNFQVDDFTVVGGGAFNSLLIAP